MESDGSPLSSPVSAVAFLSSLGRRRSLHHHLLLLSFLLHGLRRTLLRLRLLPHYERESPFLLLSWLSSMRLLLSLAASAAAD